MNSDLLKILKCPVTGALLKVNGEFLESPDGQYQYPVIEGIPCLLVGNSAPTHSGYSQLLAQNEKLCIHHEKNTRESIAKYLEGMLVPTCGNLYHRAKLTRFPIPPFPSELDNHELILDIGCNWGRWSLAAAKAGHRVIGIDIHLESLLIAKRIAEEMKIKPAPEFVLADARFLPFLDTTFDAVFSYSVIQHFSKSNARSILSEVGRILRPNGTSLIQMPNSNALRSLLILAKRGFAEGGEFDVRYYSIPELINLFSDTIGESTWKVDCFLGLNVHPHDMDLVRFPAKCVIATASFLSKFADWVPPFRRLADSVFILSRKQH